MSAAKPGAGRAIAHALSQAIARGATHYDLFDFFDDDFLDCDRFVAFFFDADFFADDRFDEDLRADDLLPAERFGADFFVDDDFFVADFFADFRGADFLDFFADDFFDRFGFGGAFPPARRASDRPMAIACLRLVTFLPERPLLSVPALRSSIAFLTFACAFLPYFAMSFLLVRVMDGASRRRSGIRPRTRTPAGGRDRCCRERARGAYRRAPRTLVGAGLPPSAPLSHRHALSRRPTVQCAARRWRAVGRTGMLTMGNRNMKRRQHVSSSKIVRQAGALALVSLLAGCATWHSMDRQEKGTATGAAGGALVGAAVGGPVGAVVGAGVGGYAGHYETQPGGIAAPKSTASANGSSATAQANSPVVRSAQQALNDRGYDVGPVDGLYGPGTQDAVVRFQQAQGLSQSGTLDAQTLSALGVAQ